MNKFGSNVVEKCLIWSGEENASMIIEEFMHSPYFVNVCRNNFGNYVVQKALEVSKVRTFKLCLLIYWSFVCGTTLANHQSMVIHICTICLRKNSSH
ncbi:hypothetical protein NC652_003099 [Populus alba x Populus x berolinensis]|nr:hypothetical protein NC652_003099 [Populus alba x Populus x berolinensis]